MPLSSAARQRFMRNTRLSKRTREEKIRNPSGRLVRRTNFRGEDLTSRAIRKVGRGLFRSAKGALRIARRVIPSRKFTVKNTRRK